MDRKALPSSASQHLQARAYTLSHYLAERYSVPYEALKTIDNLIHDTWDEAYELGLKQDPKE